MLFFDRVGRCHYTLQSRRQVKIDIGFNQSTTMLIGASVVRRTISQEFDANWLRVVVNDGLVGLEDDIDMARTDG